MARCTRCTGEAVAPFALCAECREDRRWYAAQHRARMCVDCSIPAVGRCTMCRAKRRIAVADRLVTAFGERRTLAEWSRLYSMQYSTLRLRLARGMSVEAALVTPVVCTKFVRKERVAA
jgi:hypothetical protein